MHDRERCCHCCVPVVGGTKSNCSTSLSFPLLHYLVFRRVIAVIRKSHRD